MQIILIGNYPPDKQESMERFSKNHAHGFMEAGINTELWQPVAVFGKLAKTTNSGLGKWLGYIDKWILFPFILLWRIQMKALQKKVVRYHICDHSNAPYLKYLPKDKTGITCHDVLAIRGALGFSDAYCPASRFGKILQKWILSNLSKAKFLVAISQCTHDQLQELVAGKTTDQKDWRIIYNLYRPDFKPIKDAERKSILIKAGFYSDLPFILHVGSALPRKNRKLLIDMVLSLGDRWNGNIYYAGKEIDESLKLYAESFGLKNRIVSIVKPDNLTLAALYSSCEAFIFPSLSEGFGLPVIEAQACGAPVISSNVPPMPEATNGSAIHADPAKPQEFASALLSLKDISKRNELIKKGYENIKRFEPLGVIDAYLNFHGLKRIKK